MSWLVVDAGNTAIKWAVSDATGLKFIGSGVQGHVATSDLKSQLVAAWQAVPLTAAYGVSVADRSVVDAIEQAVRAASDLEITWFKTQRHFEGRGVAHSAALLNGYKNPEQLGADRWHALIAACAKSPDESLVVVSAGTATTVDCVRAEPLAAAVFLGGVIAPGFDLMRMSLARGTAKLPLIDDLPSTPIAHPTSTEDAIATGVFYAQLGLVESVVREFAAELEHAQMEPPRLLLTGGYGRALLGPLTCSVLNEKAVGSISLESGLTLRGVALRAHNERPELMLIGEQMPAFR
ncbi:MAG: type III pantothenate kinase [Burkholderiales bacterium]|jgi:type III pantothenate kinase|nr:type III pantothenate kinase [Burkholderiales bacterium]